MAGGWERSPNTPRLFARFAAALCPPYTPPAGGTGTPASGGFAGDSITPQSGADTVALHEKPRSILTDVRLYFTQLKEVGVQKIILEKPVPKARSIEERMSEIEEEVRPCEKCPLCKERTQTVFGAGSVRADVVFVGEAPGAEEDRQGIPFVGKAGGLLTQIIESGMGIPRSKVYICNVLKCRPPGNRDPLPEEISGCEPYLVRQLSLIRPKVMVALGRIAVQTLLRDKTPISRQRGIWRDYHGVPLMPTFHPAYLLRNPNEKAHVWDDIKEVMRHLGLPIKKRRR